MSGHIAGYVSQDAYDSVKYQLEAARKDLQEALFYRAEAAKQSDELVLYIETWQEAREMAMHLLKVKMGQNDVRVRIKKEGDRLKEIRPQ